MKLEETVINVSNTAYSKLSEYYDDKQKPYTYLTMKDASPISLP